MNNWSKKKKISFVKDQNIPVYETAEYPINKILKLALIKELTKDLDCFGYCDPKSKICKKCYLFENKSCKSLTEYLSQFQTIPNKDSITMVEWNDPKEIKVMSLEYSLDKLGFKSKKSASYKIAKVILESNNKPYGDVIKKIAHIVKGSTHDAQIRFYQIRKRIEERLKFKVLIVTTKHIQIRDNA